MWNVEFIANPFFSAPTVADIAQHLELGDTYNSAELNTIRSNAAKKATVESGHAIGRIRSKYTLRVPEQTFSAGQYILLPYPGENLSIQSVTIDGTVLDVSKYSPANYGIYPAVKFVEDVHGSQIVVDYLVGSETLHDVDRTLLLMNAADLHRSHGGISANQRCMFFTPRIANQFEVLALE